MRHRYRVALYDDMVTEARLVDLLESLTRNRRQELLRTLIKAGFASLYAGVDVVSGELPPMPSRSVHDSPKNDHAGVDLPRHEDVAPPSPSSNQSHGAVPHVSNVDSENLPDTTPSGDDMGMEGDEVGVDGDDVLEDFNRMFKGLS